MGRVTINGTIAQFSCKQSVTMDIWDADRAREQDSWSHERMLSIPSNFEKLWMSEGEFIDSHCSHWANHRSVFNGIRFILPKTLCP